MKKSSQGFSVGRRTFLKASAGVAGGALLGGIPFSAFADQAALAPADRCFVFIYFRGGWDQLLALDPRDPAVYTADRIAETKIFPGYELINDATYPYTPVTPKQRAGGPVPNIQFGPAIGNLADHYDVSAVVRGINMTTLAHDVGYKYFLTGKSPVGSAPRGSSTATEIVGQMKPANPVPSMAFGVDSYNDGRYGGAANALKVSRSSDLLLTLGASKIQLDSEIEKSLLDLRGNPITCEAQAFDSRGLVKGYRDSLSQVRAVLSQGLADSFRFDARLPTDPNYAEITALRARYSLDKNGPDTSFGRAALVATALKKGISQCVSIQLNTGSLDTHFGTQKAHADQLRGTFNAVAALVDDLRESDHPSGKKFIDHTTIMIFSEFARTPLINPYGGRDHHLSSSAMLIGAGIKHNAVIGASGNIGMAPGLVDYKTGLPDPSGRNIFPEELVATVLASAKLDYAITRTSPLPSLLA